MMEVESSEHTGGNDVKKEKDTSGILLIKQEFLVSERDTTCYDGEKKINEDENCKENDDRPPQKRARWSKEEKKNRKGQNKARPVPFKVDRTSSLCSSLLDEPTDSEALHSLMVNRLDDGKIKFECRGAAACTYIHDVNAYLAAKPPDIADECPVFSLRGHCPRGLACRFGSSHLTKEGKNMINPEVLSKFVRDPRQGTVNFLQRELQESLRRHKYNFSRAEKSVAACMRGTKQDRKVAVVSSINGGVTGTPLAQLDTEERDIEKSIVIAGNANKVQESIPQQPKEDAVSNKTENNVTDNQLTENSKASNKLLCGAEVKMTDTKTSGVITDEDIVRVRETEKKKVDWHDKLYLSPLTTVGNLPFRRVCKELGADITCGEMAMASSLLQGAAQEWALTKRHRSEDVFGVQVCGNNPYVLTRCAQLLEEQISVEFIDINLGCPIDLVYQQGGGSGLLRREKVLEQVVRGMSGVLTSTPLTAKLRTGVYSGHNVAHKLVPSLAEWGITQLTLHGRSREQRYTKSPDWSYIEQCAELASRRGVPLFGNGDVLSWEDYRRVRSEYSHVAGVAIGRGALYKPWIFTEIKENRHWDISSGERLDILRKYVHCGLEHWGSDYKGVENTRRFLLEWLSFLYRYVPVGLLEHPPQQMNARPPPYMGRDDLETLMASANCADWLKISEMLLGPVPADYKFLPKHKASAWA